MYFFQDAQNVSCYKYMCHCDVSSSSPHRKRNACNPTHGTSSWVEVGFYSTLWHALVVMFRKELYQEIYSPKYNLECIVEAPIPDHDSTMCRVLDF